MDFFSKKFQRKKSRTKFVKKMTIFLIQLQDLCKSLEWPVNSGIKTGNLVTINSISENNKIYDLVRPVSSYAWIGFRKSSSYCSYYWEDGEPVTFTAWYGTEPNSFNYDCGRMRTTSPYLGKGILYNFWPIKSHVT